VTGGNDMSRACTRTSIQGYHMRVSIYSILCFDDIAPYNIENQSGVYWGVTGEPRHLE